MTTPKLRLAILVALLPPEHHGGAELQADRMARELAARGHDVHVFARRQGARRGRERRDGVSIHRRPVIPIPGLRPLGEIAIGAAQVAHARPDVILAYMTFNGGVIGAAASALTGAPCIVWQREEAEGLLYAPPWEARLTPALHRRFVSIWVQAAAFKESLRREYAAAGAAERWSRIESRVRVFGNGVDIGTVRADAIPPRRFLFIGRLVEQKDMPTLLAALRRTAGAELWIAGTGPLAAQLARDAADLPVRFLGEVPHAQLPELFRDCRALVLCSTHEGVPNVVLEALAHGRPVIATPVGAIPELIQNDVNGRIVPVRDPEAFAAAMRDLCDDAVWRRLAPASQSSVQKYSWPALVDRVEAELVRIAGGEA